MLPPSRSRTVADRAEAATLFAPLGRLPREIAAVAYLDPEWRLLRLRHVAGRRDEVSLPARRIVRDVLGCGAAALVLAHNHPSGEAEPSGADLRLTRALAQLLHPLGVSFVDHLILARDRVVSLRDRGFL